MVIDPSFAPMFSVIVNNKGKRLYLSSMKELTMPDNLPDRPNIKLPILSDENLKTAGKCYAHNYYYYFL